MTLPGFRPDEQELLTRASASVVGAGALGCFAATHLATAGVGRIGIVDPDSVGLSDLQGPLHFTPDLGASKAESAAAKLGLLNATVQAEPYPARLERMNARAIVTGSAVVLDCTSSPAPALLVNEACCAERIPLAAARALGFRALLLSVVPGHSACVRCVLPELGDDALGERGTLGAVAGIAGSIQALEAIKLLVGRDAALLDLVLQLDGRDFSQKRVETARRPGCPACAGVAASQQSS